MIYEILVLLRPLASRRAEGTDTELKREAELQRETQACRPDHAEKETAPRHENDDQRGEKDDPRHETRERLAPDVESDCEHQAHRRRGEAADEALHGAVVADALIDLEHRQHEIARHLNANDRGERAEPAIDHVADRGEIEIVLARRHAAERVGVKELIEIEDARLLHEAMLQERQQCRAIAEGEQIIGEDDEEELREAHDASSSLPRKKN